MCNMILIILVGVLAFPTTIIAENESDAMTAAVVKRVIDAVDTMGITNMTGIPKQLLTKLLRDTLSSTSQNCAMDIMMYVNGLRNMEQWALQMFDASGKPEPGLFKGATRWMGNSEQCMDIHGTTKLLGMVERNVAGEYCTLEMVLPKNVSSLMGMNAGGAGAVLGAGGPPSMYWDICVPGTCSSKDLNGLFNAISNLANDQGYGKFGFTAYCKAEKDSNFSKDGVAIFAAAFFGLCTLVILFCTVVDGLGLANNVTSAPDAESHKAMNGYANNGFIPSEKESVELAEVNTSGNVTLSDKETKSTNGIHGIVQVLSLYRNAPKLMSANKSPGTLTCLNGIRVLSMAWIILGHTYSISIATSRGPITKNILQMFEKMQELLFEGIFNGTFSVDTFFLLSGLLVTYLFLNQLKKEGFKLKSLIVFYLHRFWRLLPMYGAVMLATTAFTKYVLSDSNFYGGEIDSENCKKYWWRNLLYINNLFPREEGCMSVTWYLANDMQMYVISPLIIFPLFYKPIAGLVLILGLIATHIGVTLYEYSKLPLQGAWITPGFQEIYIKPWCRIGPYAIGMAIAYILHKTNCKLNLNKKLLLIMWCLGLSCIFVTVYVEFTNGRGGHPAWSETATEVYAAVSRPIWALGVGWVMLACCTGHGGIINSILSWSVWSPLSRLTYGAYLIHIPLMIAYTFNRQTLIYYSDYTMVYLFLGHWMLTYAAAFVFSVVFESPMMTLEKIILKK